MIWLLGLLLACSSGPAVVVVGGGAAGLAAAHAAAAEGASVTLLEAGTELGGSARWGAAVTWAPTKEEAASWWSDGEDAIAARYRYVTHVRPQVVEGLGLQFVSVPDPSGEGATLLAPVGGGRAVVDALVSRVRAADVVVRTGCAVSSIDAGTDRWQIDAGSCGVIRADRVVLATGGFMGNLREAAARLGLGGTRLLRGAPAHADGSGLRLAATAGAQVPSPVAGLVYSHAVPHPSDADAAVMIVGGAADLAVVDRTGERQDDLLRARGGEGARLLSLPGSSAWLLGAERTFRRMKGRSVEGAPVSLAAVAEAHGHRANTLAELESVLKVEAGSLQRLVFVEGERPTSERPLPPKGRYLAMPLYAATAKSLGGVVVDAQGAVLNAQQQPIEGLFAAGELTGFGAPYQGDDRDSTMVAGAIISGVAAGRAASLSH